MLEEKKCTTCHQVKPLVEFAKRPERKSGYGSRCLPCQKEARKKITDKWLDTPKKEFAPRACNTCGIVKDATEYWAVKGCVDGYQLQCKRCKHIWTKYGITSADYERMLAEQSGLCKICEDVMSPLPHIDHDHTTGKVRGLLCARCNRGIGQFRDAPKLLLAAVAYLEGAE